MCYFRLIKQLPERLMPEIKLAPKEIFDQMLEWGVMPTFDIVLEVGKKGVIIVKRTIAPYKNQWALPGLRMYKGEDIDDVIHRIARNEIGIMLSEDCPKKIMGQFVGKFKTEHGRQDLSTGYLIKVDSDIDIKYNSEHFSDFKLINSKESIPKNIGAMYKYYLELYFTKR